jgi:hypothetical protein
MRWKRTIRKSFWLGMGFEFNGFREVGDFENGA